MLLRTTVLVQDAQRLLHLLHVLIHDFAPALTSCESAALSVPLCRTQLLYLIWFPNRCTARSNICCCKQRSKRSSEKGAYMRAIRELQVDELSQLTHLGGQVAWALQSTAGGGVSLAAVG